MVGLRVFAVSPFSAVGMTVIRVASDTTSLAPLVEPGGPLPGPATVNVGAPASLSGAGIAPSAGNPVRME